MSTLFCVMFTLSLCTNVYAYQLAPPRTSLGVWQTLEKWISRGFQAYHKKESAGGHLIPTTPLSCPNSEQTYLYMPL